MVSRLSIDHLDMTCSIGHIAALRMGCIFDVALWGWRGDDSQGVVLSVGPPLDWGSLESLSIVPSLVLPRV